MTEREDAESKLDVDEEEYDYNKIISVSLPSELVKEIRERARREHRKKSQIVAKGLEKVFFEGDEDTELWRDETTEKLNGIDAKQNTVLRTLRKGISTFVGEPKKKEIDEWEDDWEREGEVEQGVFSLEEDADGNPILARTVRKVGELLGKAKKKVKEATIAEMVDLLEGEGYTVTKA